MSGLPSIGIDVGHNRVGDGGAAYQGYKEDDIVMAIGLELKAICDQKGVETVWCLPTKGTTQGASLAERVRIANAAKVDIFCSIHANSSTPTEHPVGVEVFGLSTGSKAIAGRIVRKISDLGLKDRGVKTLLPSGYPPYVLANTRMFAVLVEVFFLSSAADRQIWDRLGAKAFAQAIFKGLIEERNPVSASLGSHPSQLQSAPIVQEKSSRTVLDVIVGGGCSTHGVKGLSDRVIARMGNKNLLKFTHPNFIATQTCDPYFQPHVHQELVRLFEANPNRRMQVNSAYRSCVRQAVLREFYSRGICSISMAARVGHSNHEHGTAIDVENWQEWKPILTRAGWRWQGSKDPMHFELPSRQQIAIASIRAFQEVYNELFSAQKILTDGVWGPNTLAALLRTPADGGISAKIPYFDRYLRLGDNGADVVRYAQQLRTAGFYPQKIEHNRFETPLRDATISYQKSRGLVGDGVVGPATIIELFASVNPNPFAIFID